MSKSIAGVRLCDKCSTAIGLAKRARKARLRTKVNPGLTSVREAKAERLARLREIRDALLQETGGRCCVYGDRIDSETMHMHHIIGGGSRRSKESALTCAPLSARAHRDVHAGDRQALILLLAWCELTERTEAAAALRRRLNKIEEARR